MRIRIQVVLPLLLAVGCAPTERGPAPFSVPAPSANATADPLPSVDPAGTVAADGTAISVRHDPTATWASGAQPVYDDAAYVALARALAPSGFDLDGCAAHLPEELRSLADPPPPFDPWGADELRDDLMLGLGISRFLDGLDARSLEVVLVDQRLDGGVREQVLLATDPLVGTMQWRLLWPDVGSASLAAIIALPGHPSTDAAAQEFIDLAHGRDYPRNGRLLAVSSNRVYDAWYAESEANAYLLCAGSSLMAVRHYETLLLDRYLRYLGIDDIALVGHSGGSIALNALVRWDWRWTGAVSDMESNYASGLPCELDEPGGAWCLLDEVHPHLASRFPQINDLGLAPRQVP